MTREPTTTMTTKKSRAAFATPDREGGEPSSTGMMTSGHHHHDHQQETPTAPNSVTPPESAMREGNASLGKQVRFDAEKQNVQEADMEPKSSSDGKGGLVSRRGGRYGSPGRSRPRDDGVLEFKTFRSPQRTRVVVKEENDAVPSLCSSKSGELTCTNSTTGSDAVANSPLEKPNDEQIVPLTMKDGRPNSISVDQSQVNTTSPLTSSPSTNKITTRATTPTNKIETKEEKSFVLSPPNRTPVSLPVEKRKTPTRSPTIPLGFQSLPSLHDAKICSPCGTFLSPYLPSPSAYSMIAGDHSFDRDDPRRKRFEEEKSPKSRDQERARAVATPTDFAVDFGRGHKSSPSFDASNVLAWLQSPTANGLFSPGDLGSAHGTPRGFGGPRTPRTPTVSTSFFFSDVASLPRNGEFASPKPGTAPRPSGASGMSSMICISPLASSKRKHRDSRTNTPMNYKDIFASPRLVTASIKPRNMPLLGDSPSKSTRSRTRSDASLDAVDMAERDLMEDEDLSVLLQLAAHSRGNTPRGIKDENGAHVFRSPRDRKSVGYGRDDRLQLPMIGNGHEGSTKLARKSLSRDDANADDFNPPPLGIRASSSGGSREIYTRGDGDVDQDKKTGMSMDHLKENRPDAGKKKGSSQPISKSDKGKNKTSKKMPPPGYSMSHSHYHHTDAPPYYHMPPGGSMRVVVGGPPPMRGKKGTGSPSRPPGNSPQRHPHHMEGPYGAPYPGPYPPPPPGVYASYPPPPYMSSGGPPYSHYPPPPPRHMPMYAAQHPPSSSIKEGPKKSKLLKPSKASNKRPLPPTPGQVVASVEKKRKKSPVKTSSSKKMSPISEPAERHKSTAAIQAVNVASGGMNDQAAALAAAILRGVTMRPSGKWQAQLYYAGKSRYIGVFDTREKAALAYEIAREKLKADNKTPADQSAQSLKATENAVNSARKAAFEGVNEKDPRAPSK